jgi:hypothetical protein
MIHVHAFNLTRSGIAYALRMAGYSGHAEVYELLANGKQRWLQQEREGV